MAVASRSLLCCAALGILSSTSLAASPPTDKTPAPNSGNPPVIATPVPEPSTNSLLLLSLGASVLALKLRKRA